MVVDNICKIHICYYEAIGADLNYAHYDGNKWSTIVVDGINSNVGKYSSIDIDSNNDIHISYYA